MAAIPQNVRSKLVVEVGQRPTRYPIYPNLMIISTHTQAGRREQKAGERRKETKHESVASDDNGTHRTYTSV